MNNVLLRVDNALSETENPTIPSTLKKAEHNEKEVTVKLQGGVSIKLCSSCASNNNIEGKIKSRRRKSVAKDKDEAKKPKRTTAQKDTTENVSKPRKTKKVQAQTNDEQPQLTQNEEIDKKITKKPRVVKTTRPVKTIKAADSTVEGTATDNLKAKRPRKRTVKKNESEENHEPALETTTDPNSIEEKNKKNNNNSREKNIKAEKKNCLDTKDDKLSNRDETDPKIVSEKKLMNSSLEKKNTTKKNHSELASKNSSNLLPEEVFADMEISNLVDSINEKIKLTEAANSTMEQSGSDFNFSMNDIYIESSQPIGIGDNFISLRSRKINQGSNKQRAGAGNEEEIKVNKSQPTRSKNVNDDSHEETTHLLDKKHINMKDDDNQLTNESSNCIKNFDLKHQKEASTKSNGKKTNVSAKNKNGKKMNNSKVAHAMEKLNQTKINEVFKDVEFPDSTHSVSKNIKTEMTDSNASKDGIFDWYHSNEEISIEVDNSDPINTNQGAIKKKVSKLDCRRKSKNIAESHVVASDSKERKKTNLKVKKPAKLKSIKSSAEKKRMSEKNLKKQKQLGKAVEEMSKHFANFHIGKINQLHLSPRLPDYESDSSWSSSSSECSCSCSCRRESSDGLSCKCWKCKMEMDDDSELTSSSETYTSDTSYYSDSNGSTSAPSKSKQHSKSLSKYNLRSKHHNDCF